jgi:hypothetical protein
MTPFPRGKPANTGLPALLAISLLFTTSTAHAEERPATTAETQALRLELASVNAQHDTAVTIHIVSAVVGVAGVGSLLGALGSAIAGPPSGDVVVIPPVLVIVGGSLSIVNFILTCIGAGLDFGSASHRRKLLRAHPELNVELTPGPGEAGLGFAVHF